MKFRASQFPFAYNFKDSVPPGEACLYGQINWSLAQGQQESSLGVSQTSTFIRGGKVS